MKPVKNPVSDNHPDYESLMAKVKRCRDACQGSDAIKAGGIEYLPALSTHTTAKGASKYEAYKKRALWYNASRRTKIGLSGAVTRAEPQIKTGAKYDPLARQIAAKYGSIVEELLEAGRLAISVNKVGFDDPQFRFWWSEQIVNWGYRVMNGKPQLRFVILEDDESTVDSSSIEAAITSTHQTVRHVYAMVNEECNYVKFVKQVDDTYAQVGEPVILRAVGGRALDQIPVLIAQALDIDDTGVQEPVMLDLVDVNISHYMNSADLEHGRHWTALPTAWASGFPTVDSDGNVIEFTVGGESAWITEQQGASAGYLEFSGAGLGHLSEGLKEKQSMMAVLGARLIEESKPSVESSETLKTRMTGDTSVLARICKTSSYALTWTLQMCIYFSEPAAVMGSTTDDIIGLDSDIFNEEMSPEELTSLIGALQSNAISYDVFFSKLQKGKVIPASRTIEEEREAIDAGRPGATDPFANTGGFGGGRWA